MKKHTLIYFSIGILSGILLCAGSLFCFHTIEQQKKEKEEGKLYQTYLEKYIKVYGVAERTFSESSPVSLSAIGAEYSKTLDFHSHSYTWESWTIDFQLDNVSKTPYLLYDAPKQLDYLIDGVWYHCNYYGYAENPVGKDPEQSPPEYFVAPGEHIQFSVPVMPAMAHERNLPSYAGRFWHGRYRLVMEYAEGLFTFVEFDLPETADYFGSCLYQDIK